jgi:hypothetical protein
MHYTEHDYSGGYLMTQKRILLLAALLLMLMLPVLAQAAQDNVVTRFRIVNLSPDSPPLTTYLNGASSGLQELIYPAMTGWIEAPASEVTLSFAAAGASEADALVGPVTITSADGAWTSVVVTGSSANGTLAVYRMDEHLAPIPGGCAWVTIFHGLEGAPAVDVLLDSGAVLGPSIAFPGTVAIEGEEATAVPDMGAIQTVPCDNSMTTGQGALPVQCFLLAMANAEATETPAANALPSNCALSVLLPAGTLNFQFAETAGGMTMLTLPDTELTANNYHFLAVTGTLAAPQFFTFAMDAASLVGMLENAAATQDAGA